MGRIGSDTPHPPSYAPHSSAAAGGCLRPRSLFQEAKKGGRKRMLPPSLGVGGSYWMHAMPPSKAAMLAGTNLALAPVNISLMISTTVSGLTTLVAAT